MFLFAIVAQKVITAPNEAGFFQQPLDQIILDFIIFFGWIPFGITLLWGFSEMWLTWREHLYRHHMKFMLLAIDVPAMTEQTPKAMENLFANLQGAKSAILWKEKWYEGKVQAIFSFEIVSSEGYVQFYVYTMTRYRDLVEAAIYAHYPQAEIKECEDYTNALPDTFPNDEYELWGSELKLKDRSIFPMRTYEDFEDRIAGEYKDPLAQVLEQLAKMKPGEHMWMQFVVQVIEQDWKQESVDFIKEQSGYDISKPKPLWQRALESSLTIPIEIVSTVTGAFTGDAESHVADEKAQMQIAKVLRSNPMVKEQVEGVLMKFGKLGFHVKTRIVYIARKGVYWKNARTALIKGMLLQYTHQNLNGFAMHGASTPKDDYFWQRWVYRQKQTNLIRAYKARSDKIGATPSVLATHELASLWHFPPITIMAPLVKKVESRRSQPPVELSVAMGEDQMPLGEPPGNLEHGHGAHPAALSHESAASIFEPMEVSESPARPLAPSPTEDASSAPGGAPDNLPI